MHWVVRSRAVAEHGKWCVPAGMSPQVVCARHYVPASGVCPQVCAGKWSVHAGMRQHWQVVCARPYKPASGVCPSV
jgi:hypothetical protein